jgi:3-carboxy-cis,cis-muconate cycloisomerase
MIRLRRAFALFDTRIAALIGGFDRLAAAYGEKPLMGYTRMQPALPITAGDRIRAWRDPLVRHAERLKLTQSRDIILQFGGAVGTLDKFGEKADGVRREMAERLSLVEAPQYHSQRDGIVEIASLLSMITGTLGKFGQDVALMAQARDIRLSGGGVSSAMAHKQNPVAAEVLVSLARFNAVQAGGMQQVMIHEQERSGAAWTLEWLLLPQMVMASGAALRLASELVGNIRGVGKSKEEA